MYCASEQTPILIAGQLANSCRLRRYFDADHSESVYELTPHSEDVLTFLTEVLDRNLNFIGTESRLSRIIATLSDIVVRGSADPDSACDSFDRKGIVSTTRLHQSKPVTRWKLIVQRQFESDLPTQYRTCFATR